MNTKVNLQTILVVFIVCVTVFASTNTYVNAQVGGETNMLKNAPESEIMLDPVPDGPGFISVSSHAFSPGNSNCQYEHYGAALYNVSDYLSVFSAGLTLPHNATITKVTMYFFDGAAFDDLTIYLVRASGGNSQEIMATTESFGADFINYRNVYTTDISNEVVDNQNYSYFLYLYIGPGYTDLMLTNVRIDYAYPSYEPLIMR